MRKKTKQMAKKNGLKLNKFTRKYEHRKQRRKDIRVESQEGDNS